MDPDEALKNLRALIDKLERLSDAEHYAEQEEEPDVDFTLAGLAEHIEDELVSARGLLDWLDGGGFQPRDWNRTGEIQVEKKYAPTCLGEAFAKYIEEAGESLAAVGKIGRFGLQSRHPDGGETNLEWLRRELADVRSSMLTLEGWIGIEEARSKRTEASAESASEP